VGRVVRRSSALLDHGTLIDPLRAYWDFDDLDGSERRFRALRAEALTQLARVEGLRDRFAEGELLLDEAAAEADPRVRIRVDLERGRLRRSSGDKTAALPLFERAFAAALEAGEEWLAGDAAHMCALAAADRDGFSSWTARGLEVAESSEAGAYWAGPLLNNLGWDHFDAGEHEQALEVFERALEVRLRDPENTVALEHARDAVAEARRALGESA
jgi:tetratricopeptide (TPR) repeat protein